MSAAAMRGGTFVRLLLIFFVVLLAMWDGDIGRHEERLSGGREGSTPFGKEQQRFASIVTDVLDDRVRAVPNRDLLRTKDFDQDLRWSVKDFKKHSDAFMYGLTSLGCRPGDTVATCLGNTAEQAVLIYAAARLGVVVASFDPNMTAKGDLEEAIAETNCKILLLGNSEDDARAANVAETVSDILPQLNAEHSGGIDAICDDRFPSLRHVMSTSFYKVKPSVLQFRHFLAYDVMARDPGKRARKFVDESTPLIQPVSALGRETELTHGELSRRAEAAKASLKIGSDDKVYLSSQNPVDLAVGLAISCEAQCPLVLAGVDGEESLFDIEGCTKRVESFSL
eukprot:g1860.t1